jgi:hypothetical protein
MGRTRDNEHDRRRTKSDFNSGNGERRLYSDMHDTRTTDARLRLKSVQSTTFFKSRANTSLDARAFIKEIASDKKRIVIEVANDKNRNKTDTLSEISDNDQELYTSTSPLKQRQGPDPVYIVTGISNVVSDGGKLKVINNKKNNENQRGLRRNQRLNEDDEMDDIIEIDKRKLASTVVSKNSGFQNIRIKIDNDRSSAVHKSTSNANRDYDDSDMTESMDYQEPVAQRTKSETLSSSVYKPQSIDLHNNNGCKLIVSNLHPKVTEDDILVILRFYKLISYLAY